MQHSERLQAELHHLLWLMEPPFTENWKAYAWAEALKRAHSNAELADLPRLLEAEMKQRAERKPSGPE